MKLHRSPAPFKVLSVILVLALGVAPDIWAQQPAVSGPSTAQASPAAQQPQQNPAPAQPAGAQEQSTPQQPQPSGTTVSPSQPPLQPAPVTTYPGGQEPQQPAQAAQAPEGPKPKQQPQQPLGAATAEKVATAGGAAAKPAGAAIAPAQQHQTRSLLIKLGAVAAAGVAIGTVFALSKGSPSKPPGAP